MKRKREADRGVRSGSAGFTLIEVAIVLVIIGILAMMAIPKFLQASERAKRGSCLSNQRNLMVATVLYSADTGILDGVISSSDLHDGAYTTDGTCDCPSGTAAGFDDYEIRLVDGRIAWTTCLIAGDEHLLEF